MNPTLVQALTGHGGFAYYLHKFKCRDSPSCVCDPDVEETVVHLIEECPKYESHRYDLEVQMDRKLSNKNFADILNSKHKNIFIEYIELIVEDAKSRNKNR